MSNRKSMLIFLILTVFFLIISGCDGTTDDSLQETRTSMDLGITAGDGDILIEGEKADLDKEYFFDRDEKVTLEAVPAEDYGLSEWSTGDTETEITLVMTEDQNLTAEFLLEPQIDGNIEAAEVETGRSLEDSELTGTFQHPRGENEEIKGDLDWSNKEKLVSSAGDYEWTFTVDDTEYEEGEVLSEIKGEVKVEVITVEPEPEEDTLNAGKIEAGESLSSSELEGEFVNPHSSELNVDGELEWEAPDEEVKSPGDFEWEFVPEDDDSYEETEGEVYVGVVEDDKELPFAEITAFDALADAEQGEEIGDNVTGTVKNQGDETESKTIEVRFTDDGSYDDEVLYTTDKKLDADEEYDLGDEIAAEDVVIPDDAETGDQTIELWTEDDSSSQTINIESATDVSAEADTGTATADGSDELQFTVTVEDADSNPVEGVQVITEDDAAGTVSYDGDDDQTTDENGEIEVKANSEDAEENITFTFTAKESGDENSDTAKGTFEAGKVDTIDAEDITVTAGEEGTINVIAEDEYGNKVEGETISVEEADGLDGISSGEEADTNSEGIASFAFTEDTPDGYSPKFSAEDGTITDTATVTVEAGDVDTIDAEDVAVTAGEEGTIEVTAEDKDGNKVEGETISVEDTDGLDGISAEDTEDTNSEGIASFTFTEDTADDYSPQFSAKDGAITDAANITVEPAEPDRLEITDDPETITAGDSFDLTIKAEDEYGNAVTDKSLDNLDITSDKDEEVYSETSVDLDANGEYTADISEDEVITADDTHKLTADADDADSDSVNITVESGDVSSLDAGDATSEAGSEGTIEVTAEDEHGNKLENETVEVQDAGGLDGISAEDTEDTNSEGIASFTFTEDTADDYSPEFSAEDGTITDTANVTVEAGDADSVDVEYQPAATPAGVVIESDENGHPAAKVTDENGNAVEGVDIDVTANDGDGNEYTPDTGTTSQTTDSDGIATFNDLEIDTEDDYELVFSIDSADDNVDSDNSATSNTFTVEEPLVKSITVDEQPDTLEYVSGDSLELDGLVIEESYTDGTTDATAYDDADWDDYNADPANGDELDEDDDGETITVTHDDSGETADTEDIKVGEAGVSIQDDEGFDLSDPEYVLVDIEWNDADEVTDVALDGTTLTEDESDGYEVDDLSDPPTLTVKQEAIENENPTDGETLPVEVTFDIGEDSFEINVVETEGSDIVADDAEASASSEEALAEDLDPNNVLDRDTDTRWASSDEFDPIEWIKIDLGSEENFTAIGVDWEAAATYYEIYVSDDEEDWTQVQSGESSSDYNFTTDEIEIISFDEEVNARYIKLEADGTHGTAGVSIFEFYVYD